MTEPEIRWDWISWIASWTGGWILFSLSSLHFYWAAGGNYGKNRAVPEWKGKPAFVPGKISTLAVALLLFVASVLPIGWKLRLFLPIPEHVVRYGIYFLSFVFLLRAIGDFRFVGFFKSVSGTDFAEADSIFYSPLCLFLSVCLFLSTR
ncbi:DUF3995 domain-containing protein [Leptospira gomenensis]|uniref:DUF3995 domain-containing protein n=1 Tax=Leptospira gomenensis TaxID=2484974 RepID=A0A5F1Y7D2_9LEPT|nr:DUF3995 domain-containing protein [Leptospira gomenensis]TGK28976.1 DUF3995 domain-containing protein [Leptospira gomenensis]TGK32799.1 DUF3995 domain-containing protein [Leptospira gomenensis]TGK40735.1 DUF3995 domain-containing protein [Leptospira gomenensis]TGK68421.1 DUF3995 domain-containing protein [Leptospira gomenensis]